MTIRSNGSPMWRARFSRTPVEHDDRVVDAEADDGQHRGHEQGIDLDPEERAQDRECADDDDHVVDQGDQRRRAEADVLEADGHPDDDPDRAEENEQGSLLGELLADHRPDGRQGALGDDRPELRLERSGDRAELAGGRQLRARATGTGDARRPRGRPAADYRPGSTRDQPRRTRPATDWGRPTLMRSGLPRRMWTRSARTRPRPMAMPRRTPTHPGRSSRLAQPKAKVSVPVPPAGRPGGS